MGIFSRVSDIITANLNVLLDRAEDPEAMLAQVIREMEDGVSQARRAAAAAIASERQTRREADDHRLRAEHWKARARAALAVGREELARRALARKLEHDAVAGELEQEHEDAARASDSARAGLHALEVRLAEAQRRQRSLTVRHRAARTRVEMHRQLRCLGLGSGASLARLERWEGRLGLLAEELAAEADLHNSAPLETELDRLGHEAALDREWRALKRECGTSGPGGGGTPESGT